jgi:hypothetical protein
LPGFFSLSLRASRGEAISYKRTNKGRGHGP